MKFWQLLARFLIAFLILNTAVSVLNVMAEQPMDKQERETMLQAQAEAAAKQAKKRYVNEAMKRTELPDDEFIEHAREDVRGMGQDLLSCWSELENIKKILLQRKP